jgi:hypothetical protein
MCHQKYGSQSAFWEPNREPFFSSFANRNRTAVPVPGIFRNRRALALSDALQQDSLGIKAVTEKRDFLEVFWTRTSARSLVNKTNQYVLYNNLQ